MDRSYGDAEVILEVKIARVCVSIASSLERTALSVH